MELVDQKWAEGNAERLVTLASDIQPQAPQLPPALQKCLLRSLADKRAAQKAKARAAEAKSDTPPPEPSADALVLAAKKKERDRELCAYQIFKWHDDQRKKVAKK